MYFPLRKEEYSQPPPNGYTLLLRGLPGVDVIAAVRKEVAALDPNISIFNAESMPEQIDRFMAPLRIASWTYALIGIFGLLLASIGLAGMTAYSVAQRGHEIAIRRALGASDRSVLGLVMKEGVLLVAIGMSIGLVGEWAGTRILWAMNASVGQVTPTSASDPVVLAGSPVLLAVLTLIACYLPARKSMRIDPVAALREE
jgi:ABC-type antimicrobial peptide transport system permease subunit